MYLYACSPNPKSTTNRDERAEPGKILVVEIQSISFVCAVFCHSEPKLATLKFLRRQKNLPPTAVNQKHPGFGRFSLSPFERRFAFFLSRSVGQKTGNLTT
jgi:hypothetical protein